MSSRALQPQQNHDGGAPAPAAEFEQRERERRAARVPFGVRLYYDWLLEKPLGRTEPVP